VTPDLTLIDSGPLIALLDANDPLHEECLYVSQHLLTLQMATTWPCFAEAMYLLGIAGGYRYQEKLWRIRHDGRLDIIEITSRETDRMAQLMSMYHESPMDIADASLIAVAEIRGICELFTIDSDFYFYSLVNGSTMKVDGMESCSFTVLE